MMLEIERLKFSYPKATILEEVSFSAQAGEFVAILGVNGTGKSTFLKCINGILKPSGGTIHIEGENLATFSRKKIAQKIGYVEQSRIANHSTVFDTVLLGRKPYIKWDISDRDIEIAAQSLERIGIAHYGPRYVDELSGGELQKVMIARTLAQDTNVFLMDEPTSNLDLKSQLEVLEIVRQLVKERGAVALIAIHDINLAIRFADKFIFIKDQKIHAFGGEEIITEALIEEVYSVPVHISEHANRKFIIPL